MWSIKYTSHRCSHIPSRDERKDAGGKDRLSQSCEWPRSFYHWFFCLCFSLLSLVKLDDLPLGSQHNLSLNGFAALLAVEDLPVSPSTSNLSRPVTHLVSCSWHFPHSASVTTPLCLPPPHVTEPHTCASNLESHHQEPFCVQILVDLFF